MARAYVLAGRAIGDPHVNPRSVYNVHSYHAGHGANSKQVSATKQDPSTKPRVDGTFPYFFPFMGPPALIRVVEMPHDVTQRGNGRPFILSEDAGRDA